MSPRHRHHAITPDKMITPEQAVETRPVTDYPEFVRFMEQPSMFSVKPLIRKLVAEAFPDHHDAPSYFAGDFASGRRLEDEVSKFPVFPVSKMPGMDKVLADVVLSWSYPTQKYSFGPQDELNELIVRSDSELAHHALVSHITLPFPRAHQSVWDGPNEMEYKSGLVEDLFSAVTYHGTPDVNPLATQSLLEVYASTREGGFTYEWAKEQEEGLTDEEKNYRSNGPTTRNLRDMQDQMLVRFMCYPHPTFDKVVTETLSTEAVDGKRLFTVLSTLVQGNLRRRSDDYYENIVDQVITPYDEQTAQLVKNYLAHRWGRSNESAAQQAQAARELSRRIVAVELARSTGSNNGQPTNDDLLKFAVTLHPLDRLYIAFDKNGESKWAKSPNYYDDLEYVISLVRTPGHPRIRRHAAWHIADSFKHDYSYDDKPRWVKTTYMMMADAILSTNPGDYGAIVESDAARVMDAMNMMIDGSPLALDHMTTDDLQKFMAYRDAYETFRSSYHDYINLVSGDDIGGAHGYEAQEAVWQQLHDADCLSRGFNTIAQQLGERLEWQEIQTKPARYAEYLTVNVRNYAERFALHADRNSKYGAEGLQGFKQAIEAKAMNAESILRRMLAGENVQDQLVRFVAECTVLYKKYYNTPLGYDNRFRLEFKTVLNGITWNMPLPLQARVLELIEQGKIADFLTENEKAKIRRALK